MDGRLVDRRPVLADERLNGLRLVLEHDKGLLLLVGLEQLAFDDGAESLQIG